MSWLSRQSPVQSSAGLVLASASPRRRELLALTGWPFLTASITIDETPRPGETPDSLVRRLSLEKARAAAQARGRAPGCILSADTVVADREEVLGKPRSRAEARKFLRQLRGREHWVLTGVTLLEPVSSRSWTELARTTVRMREYTDAELEKYLDSGDPMDKAGAYGIQNKEFHPVADLEGCYANVMGLPLCQVQNLLVAAGLEPRTNPPALCSSQLGYPCSIAEAQR